MNVTDALRKIFSQPQYTDESMITSQHFSLLLRQLSDYRHEVMMSPDYRADFVPTASDMLNEPKCLWTYQLVRRLTSKIELMTELLKTPDCISGERLERVLRALFWQFDAIVPDNKLDDGRYHEQLDSLTNRIEVIAQLLQIPRSRITEALMIITYYHTGLRGVVSSYYLIIHRWIDQADGTLKTLPLPPKMLFESQQCRVERRTESLQKNLLLKDTPRPGYGWDERSPALPPESLC